MTVNARTANGSFPAEATTVTRETIDLPLGILDFPRYTREENGETVSTTTMASSTPGPR